MFEGLRITAPLLMNHPGDSQRCVKIGSPRTRMGFHLKSCLNHPQKGTLKIIPGKCYQLEEMSRQWYFRGCCEVSPCPAGFPIFRFWRCETYGHGSKQRTPQGTSQSPTKTDYNGWCTYPKMVPLVLTHGHIAFFAHRSLFPFVRVFW